MSGAAAGWSYHNDVAIRFGAGRLADLPELAAGRRALIVTSAGFSRRGLTAQLAGWLPGAAVFDQVQPNPDLAALEQAGERLCGVPIELVVALGGGSAIDTGKVLSVLLAAEPPAQLRAHLLSGAALPAGRPLPLIAIPTTAGTGSEVTPFATVWDHASAKKYSLARPDLRPAVALLDPELTLGLPAELTIASGLDALSQGLEAIWNRNATPISTLYASQALALARLALSRLLAEPGSLTLRAQMLQASLLAGLAISQTRTALAHAISYPLTARYGLPHGLACSFTLPALLAFNAAADDGRLAELAAQLGAGSPAGLGRELAALLRQLGVRELLARYLPRDPGAVAALAPEMLTPGRADNTMRPASAADVERIVLEALAALE